MLNIIRFTLKKLEDIVLSAIDVVRMKREENIVSQITVRWDLSLIMSLWNSNLHHTKHYIM